MKLNPICQYMFEQKIIKKDKDNLETSVSHCVYTIYMYHILIIEVLVVFIGRLHCTKRNLYRYITT